jgi:hypothetical protein
MATPKLQTSYQQRAAEIATILPMLADGRFVVIGAKNSINLTNAERCSCGDHRYAKKTCKHMIAVIERAH